MDYSAANLSYFFKVMYNGVLQSTLDDYFRPGDAAFDATMHLTVQYDCPAVAFALVDICCPSKHPCSREGGQALQVAGYEARVPLGQHGAWIRAC
jgi:hypothetical protein